MRNGDTTSPPQVPTIYIYIYRLGAILVIHLLLKKFSYLSSLGRTSGFIG